MGTVGNRLRFTRRRNVETQKSLAEAINITQHMVSDWETDKREIPVWAIRAICNRYKISSDWLLGLEEK
ncbi:MAG: helix-turn-helix domain-containing protein [Lachnospiraceae bacterium]|nr:helix-turn-helix domain-containing protein [Lachnospiraceae bacterium]